MYARSTSSRWNVDGNLGADPNPPHSGSNTPASCCSVAFTVSRPGTAFWGSVSALRPAAVTSALAFCSRSSRRLRHTSSSPSITRRNCSLREVRAAPERAPVVVEGDGHRPAAAPGQRLHGVHVDGVDVGSLLAVDLDAHERRVHRRRHVVVLERLVRHHVAPVTGRVADAEQDRHVALAGGGERLRAPRVPVDRDCRGAGEGTATSRRPAGSRGDVPASTALRRGRWLRRRRGSRRRRG